MALVNQIRKTDEEAGLIRTEADDQAVTGYTAAAVDYDKNDDSIAAAARRIIAEESPIQQQAVTRANQNMHGRGLLPSTLNTQAAQAAAYDYAVPMATNDTNNMLAARAANAQSTNQARGLVAQAQNQSRTIEQQAAAERSLIDARVQGELQLQTNTQTHDVRMQGLDDATRTKLQLLSGDQAQDLAKLEGEYSKINATTQSASLYFSNMAQGIAEILAQPDLSVEVKQQLISNMTGNARTFLGFIGTVNDLDLNDILTASGLTPATPGSTEDPANPRPDGYPDYLPWPPVINY